MKAPALTLVLLSSVLLAANAAAAPINTDTALPVSRDTVLWRNQVRILKAKDSSRDLEVITVSSVFVYGVTEKFALIGIVPYLDKSSTKGGIQRSVAGLGDITLLGRYQIFQLDRPGETFRAQVLGGLKFPTGRDDKSDVMGHLPPPMQLGSGSYDPILSGVFSWQRLRWQADFDFSYKINPKANDFRFGNTLAHDAAFQYRLSPRMLPDQGAPPFVYGVLELNGRWTDPSKRADVKVGDSGGYTLFVSPGLQYSTQRWVAEISVQWPLIQDLNGNQVKIDFILNTGFRIRF